MARHRWADLMIQAAENWDGLEWRESWSNGDRWSSWCKLTDCAPTFDQSEAIYELRPIHRPLFQKRVEVPRPETKAPLKNRTYFVSDPSSSDFQFMAQWDDLGTDFIRLKRGVVYLTAEDAAARGRAMVEVEE